MYEPELDPRFTRLTERLIKIDDTLFDKRKILELERLQYPNSEKKI